ncbi:phosphotransferase family protein [Nonomuraea soli]|uniref:Aminoglycoside phosphotransferase (APT) family kinase protein n=1 Tax=Nonomuraea soli TaxID=1032476 RepID=A0A7W0HRR7_9ACTN|nr:aminoglycoside phosphotransferase family protein [Nonomuraea soli]MBA2893122.1 aminoglycoside phosphotransferase (APT) family kinase protein [Nonomuraea soli]
METWSDDRVREAVAARLPHHRAGSITRLGEGEDNVAFELDGELIVRFSKDPDPESRAARIDAEARLLHAVARISPVPVPEPLFADPGLGCLGYRRLPGTPLLGLPVPDPSAARLGTTVGELLAALHAGRMVSLVELDVQPGAAWLEEAAETYAAVAGQVPAAYRPRIEAFLAAPPPHDGYEPVFSHNDLGIEHVLVDPATLAVTGVIDWSDAALCDPAYDFGLLYRDLGPVALDSALRAYGEADGIRERAVFHARCSVLEDLAYGVAAYVDKSVAAFAWLFPG